MWGSGQVEATESSTLPLSASRGHSLSGRSAILCRLNKPYVPSCKLVIKWIIKWLNRRRTPSLPLPALALWLIVPPLQSHIATNPDARETRNQLATGISISIRASLLTFPPAVQPSLFILFNLGELPWQPLPLREPRSVWYLCCTDGNHTSLGRGALNNCKCLM